MLIIFKLYIIQCVKCNNFRKRKFEKEIHKMTWQIAKEDIEFDMGKVASSGVSYNYSIFGNL